MAGFLRKLLSGATHESAHDGERSRDKTDVARIEEARQSGAIALNLRGMASTDLPVWIGELARLEQLDLSDTRLTKLPESIGQLAQLRQLNLKGTRLTELPESIGQLAQLQVLSLSGTKITALPESIGQLAQLRQLDLSGTRLTELPESIGQLARLERLDLRRMNLKRLPRSLCNLNNLTHLFLQGNSALGLPAEMLGPLPNEFPSDLMRIPPGEILEYYFHPSGKRALNEAKLILVGRGEVGKTSIVNRLIYKSFDLYERKTEGINIAPWLLRLAHEVVRLNVWDFGGQEILHATHQFFLTQRSLYILVLDGRSDNAEYDADYWLKLIGSFGGGSPVIIVL